ncbi:MAG: glycosyltransferase family 2 protein [Candidatus Azobacteroides sp.]|nr:glycosyltransferase family 2 protein [Candidatus Azobacteroides sp.]
MKKAAIVILNWNGRKLLEQFLPPLIERTPKEEADLIVADNGSTDDSIEFLKTHYPQIIIQALNKNYGFAEGYNHALDSLHYEYAVLLNSDVEVGKDWFRKAIDYLEAHPDITALQPKILQYNDPSFFEYAGASGGFMDIYGYPFCRGRILNRIEQDKGQYDRPISIFWASGACLFIRLDDFKKAGGFDTRFFAHQEEIDLCWRLNREGKKIVCLPQSIVYHVGGATLTQSSPKTYLNFRNNLLMLYKNLPVSRYKKVMRVRFFLDHLSALHFLVKGQGRNALSVWKARRDFYRLKQEYAPIRKTNGPICKQEFPDTIFRESIIRLYYFKNRKKYSQLYSN